MELPKYNELYYPLLTVLSDGKVHTFKEIKEKIKHITGLTEDAVSEKLPSGKQTVYSNRVGWAKTYLKKAGLVVTPKQAYVQITDEGRKVLESGAEITNKLLAEKYPNFAEFIKTGRKISRTDSDDEQVIETIETPQETFERVYKTINEQLADELMTAIMGQSPVFFENLVVDLMRAMGYGDGFVTKVSGDGGVDGVIHEDKLGFNLIYIQAKRWDTDKTINKPEIQKFAGAMMGPPKIEKGLFITTAQFSQGAREFADAQHIILVDGQKLTELMIEYGLGVSEQKTYSIKRIDSDYFSED